MRTPKKRPIQLPRKPRVTLPKKKARRLVLPAEDLQDQDQDAGDDVFDNIVTIPSPMRRRRRLSEQFEDEKDTELKLNSLLSVTCNIQHVPPLHVSLKPDDVTKFCRELESSLVQTGSDIAHKDAVFEVEAFTLHGIRMTEHDPDSFMIQVFKHTGDKDGNDTDRKLIFNSLFTSCGSTGRFLTSKNKAPTAKNLPVFIWHGKSSVWEVVQPILESKLQCSFHNVHLSATHMQIFSGIWLYQDIKSGVSKSKDGVKIDYQFPVFQQTKTKEIPVTSSAEISFVEWKQKLMGLEYVLENNIAMKQELMTIWQAAFDKHTSTYKIDISKADFLKVRTAFCVITCNGRVKLKNQTKLHEFLPFLSQLTRIMELR